MSDQQPEIYDCDDENLGQLLQRLFAEGHDEVEVQHPVDGPIVVTRKDFAKHIADMAKVAKMSPAERLEAKKRIENIKHQKQIRFRTAMLAAPVKTVDIEDEGNFGMTVTGEMLDIDGMIFIAAANYLPGIETVENELGAFIDESEQRQPVRIKQEQE